MSYRSVLAGGPHRGEALAQTEYPRAVSQFPVKFWWFAKHGYHPHVWQALFHGADRDNILTRNRHLVAGRRGGKTLSAAWEVLFYALHPAEFHRDAHGVENDRPLWIWVLTKDYPTGFASLTALIEIMGKAGLVKGKDYQHNKTERRIEFENGTMIQFKTADDPQSLRGAGLDILWMDEAAFIPSAAAYTVTMPALTDKEGLVITTTTPWGKNWFFDEFFTGEALADEEEFRIQYTSLDSPYLKRATIERYRKRYHPIHFKQEFLASFDAMQGIALHGDWLKYWVSGNPDVKSDDLSLKSYRTPEGTYKMRVFLGIDPALSLSDTADSFAMAVFGITDEGQGFLLDTYKGKIEFPDQLDKLREWHLRWRPELIGIESNAFQAALSQMAARMEGLPPIVPVFSKGKKNDRILRMSPHFKIGKIRIHKSQQDFIDQWVNFDPEKTNQKDDVLDAVEIALGVAGILLPVEPHIDNVDRHPANSEHQAALATLRGRAGNHRYDPELGSEG